jgi:hypothetical protein
VLDQQEALVLSDKNSKNKKTDNKTEIQEVVVQKKVDVTISSFTVTIIQNICVTEKHEYVPFRTVTIMSFYPLS